MQIEISEVNKILKLLNDTNTYNFKYNLSKEFTIVAEEKGEYWKENHQGETGKCFYILQYNQYYIKVTLFSNSYGETDESKVIQFVQPKLVNVTNYEEI